MKRWRVVLTQDAHKEVTVRARTREEAEEKALTTASLIRGWVPSGVDADVWTSVEIDAKGNALDREVA